MLDKFERQTAVPMMVLALLIVPLLVVPLVMELSEGTRSLIVALEWFIWGAFAAEYLIRLYLAPDKWRFVRRNKVDLLVVIVPFLRPLRVLRALRAAVFLARAVDAIKDVLTRHKLHYALAITTVVVIGSGLLVHSVEQGSVDGNIKTVADGLWWAITTVTTVGYGDRFPTTPAGRGIGVLLMIVGIALFGFVAGSLASFLVEQGGVACGPAASGNKRTAAAHRGEASSGQRGQRLRSCWWYSAALLRSASAAARLRNAPSRPGKTLNSMLRRNKRKPNLRPHRTGMRSPTFGYVRKSHRRNDTDVPRRF